MQRYSLAQGAQRHVRGQKHPSASVINQADLHNKFQPGSIASGFFMWVVFLQVSLHHYLFDMIGSFNVLVCHSERNEKSILDILN